MTAGNKREKELIWRWELGDTASSVKSYAFSTWLLVWSTGNIPFLKQPIAFKENGGEWKMRMLNYRQRSDTIMFIRLIILLGPQAIFPSIPQDLPSAEGVSQGTHSTAEGSNGPFPRAGLSWSWSKIQSEAFNQPVICWRCQNTQDWNSLHCTHLAPGRHYTH